MDSNKTHLSLFSAVGIEIEYMIVDKDSLTILPIADKILEHFAGEITNEITLGEISISNELVMHVIEFKTNGPKEFRFDLHKSFHSAILQVLDFLYQFNATLLPTGMHPWFNPESGVQLWPYGDKKIYSCYNKIFDCRGHGWSNLQSTHINFPFANDEEFKLLHNAIRLLLPVIPALTASSPFENGQPTAWINTRLHHYSINQQKVPSIAGHLIPEFITTEAEYENHILNPMYKAIEAWDPDRVLQEEWLNSRAAIARFDRMAIEIRIVDTQECPLADIALALLIQQSLKFIIEKTSAYLKAPLEAISLKEIFLNCIEKGSAATITNPQFLMQFDIHTNETISAKQFWIKLIDRLYQENFLSSDLFSFAATIINAGNLSERILAKTAPDDFKQCKVKQVYEKLNQCLIENNPFSG